MKKLVIIAALTVSVVASSYSPQLSQPLVDVLTPIDSVASHDDLASVFPTEIEAAQKLADIASDSASDVGIQLRAIHALTQYRRVDVGAQPHDTLAAVVQSPRYATATAGSDVIVLAAAIQALGAYPDKQASDLGVIVPFLDNPSRDVRLAAAHALRDLGNTAANLALEMRQNIEPVKQVWLAINEALRVLGTPD